MARGWKNKQWLKATEHPEEKASPEFQQKDQRSPEAQSDQVAPKEPIAEPVQKKHSNPEVDHEAQSLANPSQPQSSFIINHLSDVNPFADFSMPQTNERAFKFKLGDLFEGVAQVVQNNSVLGKVWGSRGQDILLNKAFTLKFRDIDGSDNHPFADWGQAHQNFIRQAPSDYQDGITTLAGATRPSAREVSNVIFAQSSSNPNDLGASNMLWVWGQFLDHDIDLTAEGSGEVMNIPVPLGDPYFDPFFTGTMNIHFERSSYDPLTGESVPREQVNEITAFIDASNVYGSDAIREAYLRAEGGKLKTSAGDFLPFNVEGLPNAGGDNPTLFIAGDVRANENAILTSMHTVFVREHNRIVDELALSHPEYSDEQLYQHAKAMIEGVVQKITYSEFLPILVGENALSAYSGYRLDVNPQITNEFATAAFRLGHTLLSSTLFRYNEDGSTYESHLALKDVFFNPSIMADSENISALFRGVASSFSEALDHQLIDDVRNFLFGPPGAGGLDLASLNIQRGRDHGLTDYNSMRESYGLEKATSFADITQDITLQNKLAALYGDVDNIDVYAGGLVEDAVSGSMLGELFHTIVVDQFTRLRDGDSFWYERRFDTESLQIIEETTLSDIIVRNTDIDYLQDNVFLQFARLGGDDTANVITGTSGNDVLLGFEDNDVIEGNEGDDYIAGGKGNDSLSGGEGDDIYIVEFESGEDVILDFNIFSDSDTENDILRFLDGPSSIEELIITQSGTNTVIDLSGGHQVTLNDILPEDLSPNDFDFG